MHGKLSRFPWYRVLLALLAVAVILMWGMQTSADVPGPKHLKHIEIELLPSGGQVKVVV